MRTTKIRKKQQKTTALVVGDPHLRLRHPIDDEEYITQLVAVAREKCPTFIVILGDTLDKHEVVLVPVHKRAHRMITELSEVAPLFLLIGNHDLVDNQQFLTDNHIFNPYKKWNNVTVVDKPTIQEFNDLPFVFCPYVPKKKFLKALQCGLRDGIVWSTAECIFAHQLFCGAKAGPHIVDDADVWDENFPPIISGDNHEEQIIKNIFYPGSSRQTSYGSSEKKFIWLCTFGVQQFAIRRIRLKLLPKRIVQVNVSDLDAEGEKLLSAAEDAKIRLKLRGTTSEMTMFRNTSPWYKKFRAHSNLSFAYHYTDAAASIHSELTTGKSYDEILRDLLNAENNKDLLTFAEKILKL